MNRRGFFKTLAAATAGFTILPPATTYQRIWKATKQVNPAWVSAPYEVGFLFNPMDYMGDWKFILDNGLIGPGTFPVDAGTIRFFKNEPAPKAP